MPETSTGQVILAIDQGTTNSKAALISADGRLVAGGSAPVGISSPRPGWVEQDADRIWTSVLEAMAACLAEHTRCGDRRCRALHSTGVRGGLARQHRDGPGPSDRMARPSDCCLVQSGPQRAG